MRVDISPAETMALRQIDDARRVYEWQKDHPPPPPISDALDAIIDEEKRTRG